MDPQLPPEPEAMALPEDVAPTEAAPPAADATPVADATPAAAMAEAVAASATLEAVAAPPAAPQPVVPPPPAPETWATANDASAPPAWQTDPDPAGPAPGVDFAGYGARLIAYFLDGLLLGVAIVAMWVVLTAILVGSASDGQVGTAGALVSAMIAIASILLSLLYFPYFWQKSGRTPGMRIFGIRVVRDRDGGPVTWGSAILRYIGFFIDTIVFGIPIGYLWVFFDKRRRAWHDLIGGTVVIKG